MNFSTEGNKKALRMIFRGSWTATRLALRILRLSQSHFVLLEAQHRTLLKQGSRTLDAGNKKSRSLACFFVAKDGQ